MFCMNRDVVKFICDPTSLMAKCEQGEFPWQRMAREWRTHLWKYGRQTSCPTQTKIWMNVGGLRTQGNSLRRCHRQLDSEEMFWKKIDSRRVEVQGKLNISLDHFLRNKNKNEWHMLRAPVWQYSHNVSEISQSRSIWGNAGWRLLAHWIRWHWWLVSFSLSYPYLVVGGVLVFFIFFFCYGAFIFCLRNLPIQVGKFQPRFSIY